GVCLGRAVSERRRPAGPRNRASSIAACRLGAATYSARVLSEVSRLPLREKRAPLPALARRQLAERDFAAAERELQLGAFSARAEARAAGVERASSRIDEARALGRRGEPDRHLRSSR